MNRKNNFKEQINTILSFDKEIYKKSGNRYAVYVIWFVEFLFCCFMPFMGDIEAYVMAGTINFINLLLVYSGAVVGIGENGRLVRLEVCRLYNLNINAYMMSKCILMAKCSVITAMILAIVAFVECGVTDWGRILGSLFWIFATYLANVLIVVTNEKIRYNHTIK